jgi:hypothetical protein
MMVAWPVPGAVDHLAGLIGIPAEIISVAHLWALLALQLRAMLFVLLELGWLLLCWQEPFEFPWIVAPPRELLANLSSPQCV